MRVIDTYLRNVRDIRIFPKAAAIIAICVISFFSAFALPKQDTLKQGTIMQKRDEPSLMQILKGDTVKVDTSLSQSPSLPGKSGKEYLPSQDSAYYKALRMRISPSARLEFTISRLGRSTYREEEGEQTPNEIMEKNLSLPSGYYIPRAEEIVMHDVNIENSQHIPFVKTYSATAGSGISIPLETIGKFLGMVEDVSPIMKYDLNFSSDVEVVVYSIQARVIAVMYKGTQSPGHYEYTWNARDDRGRKMPSGDYIGEVRIGTYKYIRKRIHIP